MKLSAEALPDTGRKTCSLHKLLGHSQRRRRSEVGPEFLFLQRGNHKQQCLVKLTGSVPTSHWSIRTLERGTVFLPSLQDGRKSYYYQVFGGKEQGWICVCVCVCTCMHRYTVKPLHRHRLICKYNIKYKVSSSESYHNYFTQF